MPFDYGVLFLGSPQALSTNGTLTHKPGVLEKKVLAGGKIQEQSGDKLVSLNLRVRGAKGQCRRMVQRCGLCGKELFSSLKRS